MGSIYKRIFTCFCANKLIKSNYQTEKIKNTQNKIYQSYFAWLHFFISFCDLYLIFIDFY